MFSHQVLECNWHNAESWKNTVSLNSKQLSLHLQYQLFGGGGGPDDGREDCPPSASLEHFQHICTLFSRVSVIDAANFPKMFPMKHHFKLFL